MAAHHELLKRNSGIVDFLGGVFQLIDSDGPEVDLKTPAGFFHQPENFPCFWVLTKSTMSNCVASDRRFLNCIEKVVNSI